MTNFSIVYFFVVFCSAVAFNYLKPQLRIYLLSFVSLIFLLQINWLGALIILASSTLVFYGGQQIQKQKNSNVLYYFLMIVNLSYLLVFNYIKDFGTQAMESFLMNALFFTGTSYIVLQHFAYLTDIKNESIKAETVLIRYLFCTIYFPKLINGPVARYQELYPQIIRMHATRGQFLSGINRISWGLFKLLVIGLPLSLSVDSIFHPTEQYSGLTYLVASFFITLQLYFSFSGVSDIAIGVSRFFGIELKENFFLPLRSNNMQEFWRNWHHSFTSFLSDYIFKPIYKNFSTRGWNKSVSIKIAIVLTFFAMGIWNGLHPHFITSGLLFGLFSVIYSIKNKSTHNSLLTPTGFSLKPLLVFFLISMGLLFFRVESFTQIQSIFISIFSNFIPESFTSGFFAPLASGGTLTEYFNLSVCLFMGALVLIFEKKLNEKMNHEKVSRFSIILLWVLIAVFGLINDGNNFIYMQIN